LRLSFKNPNIVRHGGICLSSQHWGVGGWGGMNQEDLEFEASLGCIGRSCLKTKTKTKTSKTYDYALAPYNLDWKKFTR
jgi:hypothetical protein